MVLACILGVPLAAAPLGQTSLQGHRRGSKTGMDMRGMGDINSMGQAWL
jgi:hypothetical protein